VYYKIHNYALVFYSYEMTAIVTSTPNPFSGRRGIAHPWLELNV